jgi:osmotically-inducible protein OsmY
MVVRPFAQPPDERVECERIDAALLQENPMKTDMQLQKDVIEELKWQPRIRDAEIAVAAKDGVITLAGQVTSYIQKFEAGRIAERVNGVRAVADEMTVELPSSSLRTDADIAHSVVSALKWNIEVPDTRITVKVENGWVTLHGDMEWQFQKSAAERSVRHLTGVKGVNDLLVVKQPPVAPSVVEDQITRALKRSATVDAARIVVNSKSGGVVVLRGTVRSWTERADAERAAWATPGVSIVQDELAVGV